MVRRFSRVAFQGRTSMTDSMSVEPEAETPVNPYSLLEAVNSSSDTAHTAWLIFLAIMAYLMVAVAGVTHKDLLLETPVSLPILQVQIQLTQFFQFAPIVLVLFHLGVVAQLVLLARKTLEFDRAVRSLEVTNRRSHPLRLELHNFFFVQAVAGPHRSLVMSAFLHGMSWLTLVALPVLLLLFIQMSFLPYHDVEITWVHRVCLVVDIAMLVLIGVFLMRSEASFFSAFWRTTVSNPVSFLLTTVILASVAMFSFVVATVPGEMLDRMAQTLTGTVSSEEGRSARANAGFTLPFFRSRADGTLWGRFYRNLVVTDQELVPRRDANGEESTISLRDRDLRFATLDRSDMRRVDLTGANLEGASLVRADLSGARLQCADISELILTDDRSKAKCVKASNANLSRAKMKGAKLAGIDIKWSKLEDADLEGADLSYAIATGANFASAHLERSDLTGGVQLQGANLLIASLQGADLYGAILHGADLSSASLQGAVLAHAQLQGASLRNADLEGADMQSAYLQLTDMSGAKIYASDLRLAVVWQTPPPPRETLALADLQGIEVRPADAEEAKVVRAAIASIENPSVRRQVADRVAPLYADAQNKRWDTSPERQIWLSYATIAQAALQETYVKDLTDQLIRLMCKAQYSNGSVATGVARRAQGPQFRGNMAAIYDKLRGNDCPAGRRMSPQVMQRLAVAIDSVGRK
jgi:uncharacterized protein YjbI with pentapeptide repeats